MSDIDTAIRNFASASASEAAHWLRRAEQLQSEAERLTATTGGPYGADAVGARQRELRHEIEDAIDRAQRAAVRADGADLGVVQLTRRDAADAAFMGQHQAVIAAASAAGRMHVFEE